MSARIDPLQSPILLYFGLDSLVCDSGVKFRRPAKYSEPSPPSFRRSKRAGK